MSSFVPPTATAVIVEPQQQQQGPPPKAQQQQVAWYWATIAIGALPSLLFSLGAAKLSYDRFRSPGWAIVAFIFSVLYYPYYAFFVSGPAAMAPTGMLGAMRRALH